MKRFRIYHPLWFSFTSRELYRDVAFNWKGYGLTYLALLVFMPVFVMLTVMQVGIAGYLGEHGDSIVKQFPNLTIKDGVASVEADEPVVIKIPDMEGGGETTLMVIDTSGRDDWLDKTDAIFMLTKTKLYAKKNESETRVYSLSEFGDMTLGKEEVKFAVGFLKYYVAPVLFPVLMTFSFVYYAFVMLAYGAIGMTFFRMWKAAPQFAVSMRLAVVAATPATLIDVAFTIMGVKFPYWLLIKYIIMLIYLNIAVKWVYGERPALGER